MWNKLFCFFYGHIWTIHKTEFKMWKQVGPKESNRLTKITPYSNESTFNGVMWSLSKDKKARPFEVHPHTIFLTYTTQDLLNGITYLYSKRCINCGKVVACDALSAQEHERDKKVLEDFLKE